MKQDVLTALFTDRQGSVLVRGGQRGGSLNYSPFGYHRERTGNGYSAFTGLWYEAGRGCYLAGAGRRGLIPTLQRFDRPDTLSPFAAGGHNAYAYCAGEPVNHVDPQGTFALATNILGTLNILAYAGMMATGYRLQKPSRAVLLVDVAVMLGAIASQVTAWVDNGKVASYMALAATTLTVVGRSGLAIHWGVKGKAKRVVSEVSWAPRTSSSTA
ncbi:MULTISPECIES: RHS repeat-associated core domain-containing protein [unclassified Pseudomonas]|uniref:RHS repeat-associated core domain-containing protein n=1 Tax=unclassified Pseudomonas TaxID=196821 RepID=UPI001402ED76|nr:MULTISPECIES: RHS repeat-associated core domain-containing protein [unclassified Pseudomonas]